MAPVYVLDACVLYPVVLRDLLLTSSAFDVFGVRWTEAILDGWIRLRMKSGVWLGGAFANANGRRSYAAGYPEPQDLYLAAAVAVDPDTGDFLLGDDGEVELLPGGLLVRWEEVEYLEFIDATPREEADP